MSSFVILLFVLTVLVVPIVAGVIIAKKKNRSPYWFLLSVIPGMGFWVFVVMLFLPPLAVCDSCNQKISADAKVCPFCETKTARYERTAEEIMADKKKRKKIILIKIFALVAIIFAMCAMVKNSVTTSFKICEPYKHSIELIESNAEAMEYLGGKVKARGIGGHLSVNANGTGKAELSYKVRGKNGDSVVYVDAEKENGVWIYKKVIFYKKPNSTDAINLLPESEEKMIALPDGAESIASAFDPELVGEVLSVIKKISHEGRTMIIVTHEMDFASDVADRVIFLDKGEIAEEGGAKELLSQPKEERTKKFLARYLGSYDYVI